MSPKKIKKLADKKYRTESGLFIVEGAKNILELLDSDFVIEEILATPAFLGRILNAINGYDARMETRVEVREVRQSELEEIGTLMTNDAGIAVVMQKESVGIDTVIAASEHNLVLMLDDVRDPGNLGTILRTADWFGVTHCIASLSTTDFYNPKTISATMGSFTRMQMTYGELEAVLIKIKEKNIPVVVADMHGESTHTSNLPHHGFLLMGSESHGVSNVGRAFATHPVTIPRFGNAESLNVSVATGILLDTLRRSN